MGCVQVIKCIEDGVPLLIENMPEKIEAVLDPVIGKRTFKRGRLTLIKVGDAEVEMHPKFRCTILCCLSNTCKVDYVEFMTPISDDTRDEEATNTNISRTLAVRFQCCARNH